MQARPYTVRCRRAPPGVQGGHRIRIQGRAAFLAPLDGVAPLRLGGGFKAVEAHNSVVVALAVVGSHNKPRARGCLFREKFFEAGSELLEAGFCCVARVDVDVVRDIDVDLFFGAHQRVELRPLVPDPLVVNKNNASKFHNAERLGLAQSCGLKERERRVNGGKRTVPISLHTSRS